MKSRRHEAGTFRTPEQGMHAYSLRPRMMCRAQAQPVQQAEAPSLPNILGPANQRLCKTTQPHDRRSKAPHRFDKG